MGDITLALPSKDGISISFRSIEDDFSYVSVSYKDIAEDFLDSLMSPVHETDDGEIVMAIKSNDAEAAQQIKDVITSLRYLADWLEHEYGKQTLGEFDLANKLDSNYIGH